MADRSYYVPWAQGSRRTYGWAAILIAVASFFLSGILAGIVWAIGVMIADPSALDELAAMAPGELPLARDLFIILALQFLLWLASILIWVFAFERRGLKSLGFIGPRFLVRYLRGLLVGAGLVVLLSAAAAGLSALLPEGVVSAPLEAPSAEAMDFSFLQDRTVQIVFLLILVFFLFQGGVEEVVFRGWLLSALSARWGLIAAAIVSSTLFAAMHVHVFASGAQAGAVMISGIAATGLFFTLYALLERSLAGVLAAHGGFNAAVVLLGLTGALAGEPETEVWEALTDVFAQSTGTAGPEAVSALGPAALVQFAVFSLLSAALGIALLKRRWASPPAGAS